MLEHLSYVERDGVGVITITRPEVHNAISLATAWLAMTSKRFLAGLSFRGDGHRKIVSLPLMDEVRRAIAAIA